MVATGGHQMEDSSCSRAPEANSNPDDLKESAAVRGLPPSPSKDDAATERAVFSSSPVLDLSQRGLCCLGEFFKIPNLQQLYLQRNALCMIPKDFFQLLPNLKWLDLRYNRLRALPSGIGSHRHLKTLLLERNPIKMLPAEMGHVTTLKALNLRHCPLEFPPQLIVQKGLVSILTFLRICSVENTFSGEEAPQEVSVAKKKSLRDLPYPMLALPQDNISNEEGLSLPFLQDVMKQNTDFFPPVDKLDLSELHKSSDSSEHWPSKDEIKHFWKLRQEIVENEKVEVLEKKLLAIKLPPDLRAALNGKGRGRQKPGPVIRRKTTPSKATCQAPLITARYNSNKNTGGQSHSSSPRAAGETVPDGAEEEMASKMRFATDLIDHGKMPVNLLGKVKQSQQRSTPKSEEMSASPLAELEERIRQHRQQVHVRRISANALQDMSMANKDLDTAKKLQDEVSKLKLEMTLNKEHPFATFTGNLSLHPPASQP